MNTQDAHKDSEQSEVEKMQRTAEVVKRMLATPPKPKKAGDQARNDRGKP